MSVKKRALVFMKIKMGSRERPDRNILIKKIAVE
jgi:hypothetical protein